MKEPTPATLLAAATRAESANQLAEADALLCRALELDPAHNLALHRRAALAQRQGRHAAAIDLFTAALASDHPAPPPAAWRVHLAGALGQAGRHADALAAADAAIALAPTSADAAYTRGIALRKLDRHADSIAALRAALALAPDHAESLAALGAALLHAPKPPAAADDAGNPVREAVPLLRRAVKLRPHDLRALNDLGNALRAIGRSDQAIPVFRRWVDARPQSADACNNLGVALQEVGDLPGAIDALRRAIALRPDWAEAHFNLALALLHHGHYAAGWVEHEWRRHLKPDALRKSPLPQPEWGGCPIDGLTILLRAEQGLGDTMQFVRYAPLVKQRGAARVILECQAKLGPLLRCAPGIDHIVERGQTLPPFDLHVRLMSLPLIFGTRADNVPATEPYLAAPSDRMPIWAERLGAFAGLKVGIAWQGSTAYAGDAFRSIPLRHFEPLARIPGVQLFSLQKGFGTEQLDDAQRTFHVHAFTPELDDDTAGAFLDTAAVIRHLDLVITSDTSLAHLAGALGVPTWVALNRAPDWRWRTTGESTPWYPTLRLFRQARAGDWAGVFAKIAKALSARAGTLPPVDHVMIPTSPGELIDRLTILRLKRDRIADPAKRARILNELGALGQVAAANLPPRAGLDQLTAQLAQANEALWEVEDALRQHESTGDFDDAFIALARSVYHANDRRAALKRQVNDLLGAAIADDKSYADYAAVRTKSSARSPQALATQPA